MTETIEHTDDCTSNLGDNYACSCGAAFAETESEFICRRTKEILGMAGFNWEDFSMQEKIMAGMNAAKEWEDSHA